MRFTKYHALGNAYLVVDPGDLGRDLMPAEIKRLCDRHYGLGADGVLYGPAQSKSCDFALRIFNPDASEAEKSGNGLRIFSRYLWDRGLVKNDKFSVETKGGKIFATVNASGTRVAVEMGRVRFTHGQDESSPAKAENIQIKHRAFAFYRVNVGNPHCVIPVDELSPSLAREYGPVIESDALFENRTNVQFMKIINRNTVQIEIWERGAGYTLASGSSSTAAAGLAYALGLCDSTVSVRMPGGNIDITLDAAFYATMEGAVSKIAEGNIVSEAFADF